MVYIKLKTFSENGKLLDICLFTVYTSSVIDCIHYMALNCWLWDLVSLIELERASSADSKRISGHRFSQVTCTNYKSYFFLSDGSVQRSVYKMIENNEETLCSMPRITEFSLN